jgi:hypothetical protein
MRLHFALPGKDCLSVIPKKKNAAYVGGSRGARYVRTALHAEMGGRMISLFDAIYLLFGVKADVILHSVDVLRGKNITEARAAYCYFLSRNMEYTWDVIGKTMKQRHDSAIRLNRLAEGWMKVYPVFEMKMLRISEMTGMKL